MKEGEVKVSFLEAFYVFLNTGGTEAVFFKIDVQLTAAVIEDLRQPLIVQGKRIDTGRGKIGCIDFVVDVVAKVVKGLFRLGVLVDETFIHSLAAQDEISFFDTFSSDRRKKALHRFDRHLAVGAEFDVLIMQKIVLYGFDAFFILEPRRMDLSDDHKEDAAFLHAFFSHAF